MSRPVRVLAGVVYFAAAALWAGLMLFSDAFKCDDACGAGGDWTDNVHAWQYTTNAWLGLAGLVLALVALTLTLAGPRLALGAFALHAVTFTGNAIVLLAGRHGATGIGRFIILGAAVGVAGFIAVAGTPRQDGHPSRITDR